jgi:hypothetical protein
MLHQLTHLTYDLLNSHFLPIWLLSLVLVIVLGWLFGADRYPVSFGQVSPEAIANPPFNLADGLSGALFCLFTGAYILTIFHGETFSYYDDDLLTEFSLQGKSLPPHIWTGVGRFYPLADQEFNLLRFVTRSPFGYHALVVVQLIVLLVVILFSLTEFRPRYRFLIASAAMVAPSFLIPFMGFVYPERNFLFGLAILLLCLKLYFRTRSRLCFVGSLVASHFILYYKETAVLFVVVFALACLSLQVYQSWSAGQRSWRELARENSLPIGLLIVAGIYTVFFLAIMLPHWHFSYISGLREPLSSALIAYLQFDWLPFLMFAAVLLRIGRFLFVRAPLDPLWDPLAMGAIAYFLGILALRINSGYYMAPVDFVALFYLATLTRIWLKNPTQLRILTVATVVICVLSHEVAYSSFRVVERKKIIATKSQLADFLSGYLPSVHGGSVEMFFPYSNGYNLMGLASYLNYRGFRLDGGSISSSDSSPTLVFKGRESFVDNRCVNYRDYVCLHAERPGPGALVVILPDDTVSMKQIHSLAQGSKELFAVDCEVCAAHHRWFDLLHTISAEFSRTPLPDHWLQLHVFRNPI